MREAADFRSIKTKTGFNEDYHADRIGADLIRGARPIAEELGWTPRQVYAAHARGHLPTFSIGNALCVRRSTLRAHIEALEASRSLAS